MSFFEDEEEEPFPEPPREREGRPRQRGRGTGGRSPLGRVVVILAAVIVLVLVSSLAIKSCLDQKKVSEFHDYFDAVAGVTKDSDAIGKQLSGMLQNPNPNMRQALEKKLGDFQSASDQIVERAKAIQAPDQFKQEDEWFIASMQVRSRGLKGLQPALLNALGAQDTQAGAAQVSEELLILLTSDVSYDEFFYQPCQNELKNEQISEVKVPESKFLTDPALASEQAAVTLLEKLKGGPQAQVSGLHDVDLVSLHVQPSGMRVKVGGQNSLKASDSLTFSVEIENIGESTETDVPVSLTLTAPGQPTPQKVDGKVPSIAPNEHKTINLTGLAAQAGPEAAILKASCGPVPGQTNLDGTTAQYQIVFS